MKVSELYDVMKELLIIHVTDGAESINLSAAQIRRRIGELDPDEPATFVFAGRLVRVISLDEDEMRVTQVFAQSSGN